jgi:4-amino-4-deoxy-L-arabinose transferase-like glycosyltransferase
MLKPAFLFVLSFAIVVFSFTLFPEGMFVDGLTYASISRNLSEGLGSIWLPHYTQYLSPEFYGHPPLSFIIQSWFFSVFGDHLWVERFYTFITFLLQLRLIQGIWNLLPTKKDNYWIPMCLWLMCGSVFWSFSNNLIENTNALFISGSVYFFIKACIKQQSHLFFLGGLSCFLSLLTKGPFGLFVLSTPMVYHLFTRKQGFFRYLKYYLIILTAIIIPLSVVLIISPESQSFFQNYFNKQIVNSVQNETTVQSRCFIVAQFIKNIAAILVIVIIVFSLFRKKIQLNPFTYILFIIALIGVFPIMISMKQSAFYITPVYPLVAISFGLIIDQVVHLKSKAYWIRPLSLILLICSILFAINSLTNYNRDEVLISQIKQLSEKTPKGSVIKIDQSYSDDYYLHAYFQRYLSASLTAHCDTCSFHLELENESRLILTKK